MSGVAGKFLGVMVNGVFISCETSCEINFGREMLPATAVDSGGWREFINGLRTWSVSVDANLILESVAADVKSILTAAFFEDFPLYIEFSTRPSAMSQISFSGTALLPNAKILGPRSGSASTSMTLQGTGPLTPSYEDLGLLIDAMPSEADYPLIIEEDV